MNDSLERFAEETRRVTRVYEGRQGDHDLYARHRPEVILQRATLLSAFSRALREAGFLPLKDRRILEVGCGRGEWLAELEAMGAERKNLAGIDLFVPVLELARARLAERRSATGELLAPGAEIVHGNAAALPWPDATFELVYQVTMFTSILDPEVRRAAAREMLRVTKPGGVLLWYDFIYDNPKNPNVRGLSPRAVRALFPGCSAQFRRLTLAPPLHRRLARWPLWLRATLEAARVLDTHCLAVLKPG